MSLKRFVPRGWLAAVIALGLCVGISACGSSSSGGSSPSSGSSGAPLKLFLDYPADNAIQNYGDMLPAAQSAVTAINKAGGVKGRKIELVSCNNMAAQSQTAVCARNAIQDGSIALVGQTDLFTPATLPLLQKAGIPSIGLYSNGYPVDYNSSVSFPLNGGSAQGYLGAPTMLKDLGYKSFSTEICGFPSCAQLATDLAEVAKSEGVKDLGNVTLPDTGVTDYSAYAAKAKALGAPVIIQALSTAPEIGTISAGDSVGYKPVYMGNDQMTGEVSKAEGTGVYQGYLLSGPFPSPRSQNIPAMKQYIAERAAAVGKTPAQFLATDKPALTWSWANSVNAWLSVHAFADAAAKIKGPITAASLLSYLKSDTTPINLYHLVSWAPGKPGPKAYPKFNAMEGYGVKLVNGKLTTMSNVKPFNVVSAIQP
jgi:ABC-type branched-subunit amino acid transport system substrate-binding protein